MKSRPRYPNTKPNKAALVEPRPDARSPHPAANGESTQDPESSADAVDATGAGAAVPVDTSIGRPGAAPFIDGEGDPPSPAPLLVAAAAGSSEDADATHPPI